MRNRPLVSLFSVIFLLLAATTAQAQYFGRNKVQYKDFKFEVLKTDHFDIYFYQDERDAAQRIGRMAERWYARLSQVFNHQMQHPPAAGPLRVAPGFRADQCRRAAASTKARAG